MSSLKTNSQSSAARGGPSVPGLRRRGPTTSTKGTFLCSILQNFRRLVIVGGLASFLISLHFAVWGRRDYPLLEGTSFLSSQKSGNSTLLSPLSQRLLSKDVSATTIVTHSAQSKGVVCECELLSVDCLDAMACLPLLSNHDNNNEENSHLLAIAQGMHVRQLVREVSPRTGPISSIYAGAPIGKQTQWMTMDVWHGWYHSDAHWLPKSFERSDDRQFLNSTHYPSCVQNGWKGKECFFTLLSEGTGEQDWDELEQQAHAKLGDRVDKAAVQHDLTVYLNTTQSSSPPPALGHLLTFSQMMRILFHRRPHVQDFCRQRLRTLRHTESENGANAQEPLTVSLHIRRADSCGNGTLETQASPLDSPAQPTHIRRCYSLGVYMDALANVQKRVGKRPMEVYLSTDHAGSVLTEIQKDFADMYQSVAAWHVLDYDRDIFEYHGGVIEGHKHNNHAILGESAIADLWHLSHGQVFVGHMGSRFGKVGWFLATARHNSFVPFFSVDGHSVCCDIDEACALVAPFVKSMEQCLTWGMERGNISKDPVTYWSEVGSLQRVKHALGEEAFAEWDAKRTGWKMTGENKGNPQTQTS